MFYSFWLASLLFPISRGKQVCCIYLYLFRREGAKELDEGRVGGNSRPAYLSVFAHISMEIVQQYGSAPIFFQIQTQVSRKYGNQDVNDVSLLPENPIVVR